MPRHARFAAVLVTFALLGSVYARPVHARFYSDFPAPIGVMGDHTHRSGDWMLSYRYMRMQMQGNRDGTHDRSSSEVIASPFSVSPKKMTTEMHMFGFMYGVSDRWTLMGMLPFVRKEMDHVRSNGDQFTTRSKGIGDVRLTALYQLEELEVQVLGSDSYVRHHLHLSTGLGIPLGDVEATASSGAQLPYPMQIGSGTFDLIPGLTYTGSLEQLSWGGQAQATLRLGRNRRSYSLGDRFLVSAWGKFQWSDWISTSLRLEYQQWRNIDGADSRLNPMMVPTADPDRRAGRRLDVLAGFDVIIPDGPLEGNRLAIELGLPAYQWLDGPQLETDWRLTAGWQISF